MSENLTYTVYSVQNNINGKLYIGMTSDFKRRKREHFNLGYKKSELYVKHLYKSMKYYGANNFTFNVIEEFNSLKESLDSEIFWISYFKSNNNEFGYNKTPGGQAGINFKMLKITDERRAQLKEKMMGENSIFTNFKNQDILSIRKEYNLSLNPDFVKLTAEKFSVSMATIYNIISGKTWSHLPVDGRTKKIKRSKACGEKISIKAKGNKRSVGSKNPQSKLTENNISYIRREWNKNPTMITRKKLSTKFKTSKENIYQITSGRRWKHVT